MGSEPSVTGGPATPVFRPRTRSVKELNTTSVLDRTTIWTNQAYGHRRPRQTVAPRRPEPLAGRPVPSTTPAAPGPGGSAGPRSGGRHHVPEKDPAPTPLVDIILPVRNQQHRLVEYVTGLHACLSTGLPFPWQLTIVDNASTDGTWALAARLTRGYRGVTAWRLPVPGRGAALRESWLGSPASIVGYLDIALAPDPEAVPRLIAPLVYGQVDMCAGSRLLGTAAARPRHIVALGYNLLLRATFRVPWSDAGCGFKAASVAAIRPLLAEVTDDSGFLDTELLLAAGRAGLRVREVPVGPARDDTAWRDLLRAGRSNLRGVLRLVWVSLRAGRRVTALRAPVPAVPAPGVPAAPPRRVPFTVRAHGARG